jgi:hypothetical protein
MNIVLKKTLYTVLMVTAMVAASEVLASGHVSARQTCCSTDIAEVYRPVGKPRRPSVFRWLSGGLRLRSTGVFSTMSPPGSTMVLPRRRCGCTREANTWLRRCGV